MSLRDVGELMERVMEGTFHSFLTQEKYNQDMREDDRFDVRDFEDFFIIDCSIMLTRDA